MELEEMAEGLKDELQTHLRKSSSNFSVSQKSRTTRSFLRRSQKVTSWRLEPVREITLTVHGVSQVESNSIKQLARDHLPSILKTKRIEAVENLVVLVTIEGSRKN